MRESLVQALDLSLLRQQSCIGACVPALLLLAAGAAASNSPPNKTPLWPESCQLPDVSFVLSATQGRRCPGAARLSSGAPGSLSCPDISPLQPALCQPLLYLRTLFVNTSSAVLKALKSCLTCFPTRTSLFFFLQALNLGRLVRSPGGALLPGQPVDGSCCALVLVQRETQHKASWLGILKI